MFSTTVYPPVWDQRTKIEDAIVLAAAEANSHHIERKKIVSILGCKFSRPHNHNKTRPCASENDDSQCRESVHQDPIVGKKNPNRVRRLKEKESQQNERRMPSANSIFAPVLYNGEYWSSSQLGRDADEINSVGW